MAAKRKWRRERVDPAAAEMAAAPRSIRRLRPIAAEDTGQ